MLQSLLGFKLKFEDSNSRIQMFGFWIFIYGSRKHKSNNNSKINAFWGVCTTFSIHDTPLTPRIHIRLILHKQTKKLGFENFQQTTILWTSRKRPKYAPAFQSPELSSFWALCAQSLSILTTVFAAIGHRMARSFMKCGASSTQNRTSVSSLRSLEAIRFSILVLVLGCRLEFFITESVLESYSEHSKSR